MKKLNKEKIISINDIRLQHNKEIVDKASLEYKEARDKDLPDRRNKYHALMNSIIILINTPGYVAKNPYDKMYYRLWKKFILIFNRKNK